MQNILVTGGAGYIGNVLIRNLLKKDFKVTVFDNFYYNQFNSILDLVSSKNLNIIENDVRNTKDLLNQVKLNDIVIPLAGIVGAPACSRNEKLATEVNTVQIKEISKNLSKDQIVILPVTNSGYGIGKEGIYCDEKSPLNPISHYGKTKVEAEKYIVDKNNFVSMRLATVFGVSGRMRTDLLVNDFVYKAYNEKSLILFESHFKRNYIHIQDISDAIIKILSDFNNFKNEIYNVGINEANLSKKELAYKIKDHLPDLEITEDEFAKDPDKRNYIVSNDKIYNKGWKPTKTLDDGIEELIKCYRFFKNKNSSNI